MEIRMWCTVIAAIVCALCTGWNISEWVHKNDERLTELEAALKNPTDREKIQALEDEIDGLEAELSEIETQRDYWYQKWKDCSPTADKTQEGAQVWQLTCDADGFDAFGD